MTRIPQLKIYSEADVLAIEAFSERSKEVVALYVRKHSTTLTREEDGRVLEARVFGCECFKVLREWLENPMPAGIKAEKMGLYRGMKDE